MKLIKEIILLISILIFLVIAVYNPQYAKEISQAIDVLVGENLCGCE